MHPPGPVPPGHETGASQPISYQIRWFSFLWLASTVGVLIAIGLASYVAGRYRDTADARARATAGTQLAVARLESSILGEENDGLSFRLTGRQQYVGQFQADLSHSNTALRALHAAAADARLGPALTRQIAHTTSAIQTWQRDLSGQMSSGGHGRAVPPAGPAQPAPEVQHISDGLGKLSTELPGATAAAIRSANRTSDVADTVRQVATLAGLILLLAGGIRLLRRAFFLAGAADKQREREARWSAQIESVLAWSGRAKEASTRSQLIGYANVAPHDAIGANCFIVSEGAPASHRSHGLPRFTRQVDDAGEGLHVSVCFAPGRGDQHDHHALDLMLGHLSALWRTVLRQEALERAAGHDALTGLPNRRSFDAELRRRIALSKRRGLGFGLAIVDLDHFKLVNDSLGHPEGDTVLRRAGEAIRSSLRSSDRVFRFGGEEFALILETADREGMEELLERAREAVKELGVEPEAGRRLSASIGWAVFPEDAGERSRLVAEADGALYRAKNGGRDQVVRAAA